MARVLIADDSAVVRLTLSRRLKTLDGVELVERDSAAATADVDASSIDCALLDYDLGDGNGVDIATRLREASPTLPIAFFTSEPDVKDRAGKFGPVFEKPTELEAAVTWVAMQRAR